VVLEDGSAATWVFISEITSPENRPRADSTLVLLSNLGVRLGLGRLRLHSIVSAGGETTRYEISEPEASVRVIGPDGRRTLYSPQPGYALVAVVDRTSGVITFQYQPEAQQPA
jgi:hypothetical protein